MVRQNASDLMPAGRGAGPGWAGFGT